MSLPAHIWCARLPVKISHVQRVVLMVLCDHHNGETGVCCPTLKTIADAGYMEEATASRAVNALQEAGLLTIKRGKWDANGRGIVNHYRLNIPAWAVEVAAGKNRGKVVAGTERLSPNVPKVDRETIEPGRNQEEEPGSTSPNGDEAPARDLFGEATETDGNKQAAVGEKRLSTDTEVATEIWNRFAGEKCGRVKRLTDARRDKMKKRLAEDFDGHLHEWARCCRRIAASPFLTGDNERGWTADFDWVLKPANLVKIEEGKYDPREAHDPYQGGVRTPL